MDANIKMQKLQDKTEQMVSFLLDNIVGEDITRQDNDISFVVPSRKKGIQPIRYLIKTLSRQSDFPFEFEEDKTGIDEDRRRLKTIKDTALKQVKDLNAQGITPGFVFLRAETDYSQVRARSELKRLGINLHELQQSVVREHLREYYKCFANYGHFLKQRLPSRENLLPHNDLKKIDPIELIFSHLYRFNDVNSQRQRTGHTRTDRTYYPGLLCFNTKEQRLEEAIFHDVDDARRYSGFACPICDTEDHTQCKKTMAYRDAVLARNKARYEKHIWATRTRTSDIRFRQAELDKAIFGIDDSLRIAVLDYR
jgi:hypothetical protein